MGNRLTARELNFISFYLREGRNFTAKNFTAKSFRKMCYVMAYNMSHIQETVILVRHVIINRSQHSRSKLIEIGK